MSRESTPASLLGGLAITGSPTSSADMPVTTRGMRNQRQRNLSASHHASSGAVAGPSREAALAAASGRRAAGARSSGSAPNRSRNQRRQGRIRRTIHDSDDDDESGDEDPDEESVGDVVNEIMSTFADIFPTPREFSELTPHNTRNVTGIEQTRDCRRLADVLTNIVTSNPDGLTFLRREFPRRYCAARIVSNLWSRDAAIMSSLQANLEDQARGRDVPNSIMDWRKLNFATIDFLGQYWNDLTDRHRQSLASLLISIVSRIFQTDRDLYAGRTRTVFAGESSGGNLFRRFLSPRAEPIAFLDPLSRLDAGLLASRMDNLRELINSFTENGEAGSEGEQYRNVYQILMGIWSRATGQQL